MNWELFYLGCFVVGFALSLISFLAGTLHLHLPSRLHLPQVHGHAHAIAGVKGMKCVSAKGVLPKGTSGLEVSPYNFATLMAFLTWFGGIGYLLTHYYHVLVMLGLGVAVLSGMGAAAVVFAFLTKVLMKYDHSLDPAEWEMVGVLAKVHIPIRAGGTGEIVYEQGGAHGVSGARSEDGAAIEKGDEVLVTRYERGIAYVRRWEEMAEQGEEKAVIGDQQ